jgi:DNA primase
LHVGHKEGNIIMIDNFTIEKIMNATNIVEVVSEFVTLRKRGANYIGLCPFHNEKTPSFSVSPSKGICKCFSCGKGGNAAHFLMEHEQISYYEALRWLAKKYGIEIREHELTPKEEMAEKDRESLFLVNDFANKYFQEMLITFPTKEQPTGLDYFRRRGFRDDIIKKFQLGYAPENWEGLSKLAAEKGYNEKFLIETGLCHARQDGSLYDVFRDRVMFPIFTISGKVVGFGGRVRNPATKGVNQKYVNSPQSKIYDKSKELYGLFQAKQAISKEKKCYMVEGYTDVLSMYQSGIENVVASSGTALTQEQVHLIHRFTTDITLLYDGDVAGIKASNKGIDKILSEGMNVKIVLLPDDDDPDSFAKKHSSAEYQEYIKSHEQDFILFLAAQLNKEGSKDPVKRAELIAHILDSIAKIPDVIKREMYIQDTSQVMNVDEKILKLQVIKKFKEFKAEEQKAREREAFHQELPSSTGIPHIEEQMQERTPVQQESATKEESSTPTSKNESLIIKMLVRYGEKVMVNIKDEEGSAVPLTVAEYINLDLTRDDLKLSNPLHRQMLKEANDHIHDAGFVCEKYFINHPDINISSLSCSLASERYTLSKVFTRNDQEIPTDEKNLHEVVPRVLADFKIIIVEEELKKSQLSLQDPTVTSDSAKLMEAMQRIKHLQEIRNQIAHMVGDRIVIPE